MLRLPIDKALVIIRGKKTLKVDKMDYSKHPDYPLLRSCKASAHVPEWRRMEMEAEGKRVGMQKAEPQKKMEAQNRTEGQKTVVQRDTEPQKNKGQNAREEKAGTRKVEAGQALPKGGAGAAPQNPGKEAKAAPRTASRAAPKAPAKNAAEQTAEKKVLVDAATENAIPEGADSGKVNRATGKQKPKTESDVKTGSAQPSGVVLTDKDSIMM